MRRATKRPSRCWTGRSPGAQEQAGTGHDGPPVDAGQSFCGHHAGLCTRVCRSDRAYKEQVERQVGLALLVTLPAVEPPRSRWRGRTLPPAIDPPVTAPPDTSATQALRYLHTRLKRLRSERPIQTVLLVAPEPGDTTATLLVDLAMVAASTGERTFLVDSNIHQPSLHSLLRCALTPGLADVLATPDVWPQSIQRTQIDNLHLVAAGTATPTTSAAFESLAFDTLLASYQKSYDSSSARLRLCLAARMRRC